MNIFKVLASGKKSFQEETASAILIWLMNPAMEHGFGYSFISKFIDGISDSLKNRELSDLVKKLKPRLRTGYEKQLTLWFNLEYNAENCFIDIIIGIDDWIIGIENKIYDKSITKDQLCRQYRGLKNKHPEAKIGMVYLVPIEEGEMLDGTEKDLKEFSVGDPDFKALVTWQKNKIDKVSSISEIIEKILSDEGNGIIDPIPEYTRHTLKALNAFISNDFSGYDYERTTSSGGMNPLTEKRLSLEELKMLSKGFVGVNYDVTGLFRMKVSEIKNYKFQYTSQEMANKRNWLEIEEFKKITRWLIEHSIEDIVWSGVFPSELLYRIACDYKQKVFIGIKGGEKALRDMGAEEIVRRKWEISTEKATAQWIDGVLFSEILKEKDVYPPWNLSTTGARVEPASLSFQ